MESFCDGNDGSVMVMRFQNFLLTSNYPAGTSRSMVMQCGAPTTWRHHGVILKYYCCACAPVQYSSPTLHAYIHCVLPAKEFWGMFTSRCVRTGRGMSVVPALADTTANERTLWGWKAALSDSVAINRITRSRYACWALLFFVAAPEDLSSVKYAVASRGRRKIYLPPATRPCKRITLFILNPRWQESSVRI